MEVITEQRLFDECFNLVRGDLSLFEKMKCTLITPLMNERDNVETLWQSIVSQSRLPDEWIIADNGSTDGTYDWLVNSARTSPIVVRVLSLPGKTIACMLNAAIESARHDVIACCHGGTRIPLGWLEALLAPFDSGGVDVSGGVWEAYGETKFEKWVAENMYHLDVEKLDGGKYLPASRSLAFTRNSWAKVKGFPEWLPKFGEDTLFGIKLHYAGCKLVVAKEALVGWRQKSSILSLLRQFFFYSEADACIGILKFDVNYVLRVFCFAICFVLGSFRDGILLGIVCCLSFLIFDMVRVLIKYSISFKDYFVLVHGVPAARNLGFLKGKVQMISGIVVMPDYDKKAVESYTSAINN